MNDKLKRIELYRMALAFTPLANVQHTYFAKDGSIEECMLGKTNLFVKKSSKKGITSSLVH